jgi:hypothetical protein
MKRSGPPFSSGPSGERTLRVAGKRSRTPIYARPARYSSRLIEPIRATLTGSDCCSTLGITATGHAPVLALSRLLIEAGHHPATALEVYRRETLALRVRSIGEAARLTVEDDRRGRPRLRRWRDRQERCGAASPVRQNESPVVSLGVGDGCAP